MYSHMNSTENIYWKQVSLFSYMHILNIDIECKTPDENKSNENICY